MKKIVYTQVNGVCAVVHPCEGARLALSVTLADGTRLSAANARPVDAFLRGWPVSGATAEWAETEDEFVERIRQKDVPANATDVLIVDESALPADRAFRNAWRVGAGGIGCDMASAKNLARDTLRAERAERFKVLDGQWMRAMGRGDSALAAEIEAKREAMRNWPQDARLDASATPDELKLSLQAILGP